MISVQGIYDGKVLKLLERIKMKSPKKVIVTFLEDPQEDISSEQLQLLIQEGGAFDFLNNEEDIYTDNDLKN